MQYTGADTLFSKILSRASRLQAKPTEPSAKRRQASITLNIPTIKPENRDELYGYAKAYIERTRLGEFNIYARPFTKQIFTDFKSLYPALNPLFSHTDKACREVLSTAIRMRVITLLVFVFYFALSLHMLTKYSKQTEAGASTLLLFAPPILFFVLVRLIRGSQIETIKRAASEFGSDFNAYLSLLNNKAGFALARVSDDEPTTDGSEIRAEQWTTIALWLFDLHQFYDRYVTTASWKLQTNFVYLTWSFRLMKYVILAGFLFFIAPNAIGAETNVIDAAANVKVAIAIYTLALLSWDITPFTGAANSIFADSFIRSVAGRNPEEILENHVNTQTARLVKKLRELYCNAVKD